jgi:hypothetical protein
MPETVLKTHYGQLRDRTVSVNGVRSPYGFWQHAGPNESVHAAFQLSKRYRRFRGAAAINDTAGSNAVTALTFRLVADGRELWKSQPQQSTGSSQPFNVDVVGVDKLELFVDCPGPHGACQSVWIEPRCER